jgi:hypothetical protein
MWAVDDEVRSELKECLTLLSSDKHDPEKTYKLITDVLRKIKDMISKENNILIPLLIDTLAFFDWVLIDGASDETGYFLEPPKQKWADKSEPSAEESPAAFDLRQEEIPFDAGRLMPEEANSIFNTLPLDITFVDAEGRVKYFSQGKERIFDRPITIIGRHVSMCHPPASVKIVEDIIESFRNGDKDHEDFWINLKGMFVHIRYFAIRNKSGEYLGTLEVTQNIKPIRELEGEKRLVSP